MTYKTLTKICGAISFFSIAYMYVVTKEGTNFGWTVFFIFLAFAILFNALDEKEEEIAILRSSKENKQEEEGRWKALTEIDPRSNDPFYISDKSKDFKKIESNQKKRLITLISTERKSSEQIFQELKQNWNKYVQVIFFRKPPTPPKKYNQPPQNNDKS